MEDVTSLGFFAGWKLSSSDSSTRFARLGDDRSSTELRRRLGERERERPVVTPRNSVL